MPRLRFAVCAIPLIFGIAPSLAAHAQPAGSFPFAVSSFANPSGSELCIDGECQPAISETIYFGRPAYRLTNGKHEAVIVPSLGRVMRYGKVGGPNLLWNSPTFQGLDWGWKNYGGDKTWLSPQSSWGVISDKPWPPDPALDGTPHQAEVITGGKLKLVSNASKTSGIRLERVMGFNEQGEFEIQQSAIKTAGSPCVLAFGACRKQYLLKPCSSPFRLTLPIKTASFVLKPGKKSKLPLSKRVCYV